MKNFWHGLIPQVSESKFKKILWCEKKKPCVTQLYVADPDFFPIWTGKHLKRLRERITNSKSIEHNFAQLSVLS